MKLTLLTPFSKHRDDWAHSQCINTHDGKSYRLDQFSRADVVTLGDILCGYIQHPEVKSLGPDGKSCKAHTRGLLRRMTINGGLQHCIGKEISRFEQGKEDFIENMKVFAKTGLTLEVANPRLDLIEATLRLSDKAADLRIVLGHLQALPLPSEPEVLKSYTNNLKELRQRRAFAKVSGVPKANPEAC